MTSSVITPNKLKFHVFRDERFIDLNLYQFGWERTEPLHSYGPHARNHYLFHYVISGKGKLFANEQVYEITGGHGFLIVPGQITTYRADEQEPWEYTWIEFDGLRVKEALTITELTKNNPVYHTHSKDIREKLVEEMLYITRHPSESPYHLIGHMYLFLDYLMQSAKSSKLVPGGKMSDFYIKEAMNYIEQNFQNDISIEDIAGVCGINRSYLGKIFKNSVGHSPQEFLMNYRMIKATELLKLTSLSIADVGSAVGYDNQLHFSRAFKNIYGVAPREWRNEHK